MGLQVVLQVVVQPALQSEHGCALTAASALIRSTRSFACWSMAVLSETMLVSSLLRLPAMPGKSRGYAMLSRCRVLRGTA